MRRTITLIALALSAFVVTPVLAAPGGNGYRGDDRGRPGYDAPSSYQSPSARPGHDVPAYRLAPAPVIHRAQLARAERIKVNYERQRMTLLRSLRIEQTRLDRLTSTRFGNRGQVRAQVRQAQRKVADLEARLARLDARYRVQLATVLTPPQVRFFLSLG